MKRAEISLRPLQHPACQRSRRAISWRRRSALRALRSFCRSERSSLRARRAKRRASSLASRLHLPDSRGRRTPSRRPTDANNLQGAMTMHDIDRTMGRTNLESYEFQAENEMGEFENE